jgi:tetratricopeptide (TPR) repeat protein
VVVPTFSSAQERATKALASYRDVEKKFGSSTAGRYATLGVANSLAQLGKPAEANTAYAKVLEAAGSDVVLRARALEGSGYALEAQQKYPDALKRFEELTKLGSGAYRVLGDYHRARILVAQNKQAEAKALLEAMSKALAANTSPEERNGFESAAESAETLLQELGGKPTEKPRVDLMNPGGGGGLSQDVLDALRKQLAAQPQEGEGDSKAPSAP